MVTVGCLTFDNLVQAEQCFERRCNFKSKVKGLVTQPCPTLCNPVDCSPPGSSVHGDSPGKNMECVAMPSSRGSSQPRDRTQVSCIAGDSLPSEPPGKLSLLPGIFLTQELNRGLLHGRQILHQLNHQGSTHIPIG